MLPAAIPRARSLQFAETKLRGCLAVQFPLFEDTRGALMKTMQRSVFERAGLQADFREVFYTDSVKGVLRGMHFQVPPADHAKLVYCISGAICDVALDLRVGSPTYGQYEVYELTAEANNAVYLPSGIAHGFLVRSPRAGVLYHVTTEHDPEHDQGILWNSFGAPWPTDNPTLSARDAGHVPFAAFRSPFVYNSPTAS
jgi:dTDP-4-dehydrorhamnose 3,5-epimerase